MTYVAYALQLTVPKAEARHLEISKLFAELRHYVG